mgnify:FL=1
MKSDHGVLHRYDLLLQACTTDAFATKDDWDVLSKSGLGVCLLDGLPDWMIKYTAGVVCSCSFIDIVNIFLGYDLKHVFPILDEVFK